MIQTGLAKPEDTPKFAGRIFNESQRLITLVNDIIKISQLDEGTLPYSVEPVDVCALIRDIFDRLAVVAKKSAVSFYLEAEKSIILDTVKPILDEILYNLCDNAVKYNCFGGSVTVTAEENSGQITVSVADTGIGIPQAHQQRIFERFYRVDKSHSKEIGGTGLGLAIVKHGAAYLGAELKLKSTPETGSTFTLIWNRT